MLRQNVLCVSESAFTAAKKKRGFELRVGADASVCPDERSSASGLSPTNGLALNGKQKGIMTSCQFGRLSRGKLPPGCSRPPRRGRLGLRGHREIADYGAIQYGTLLNT